MPDSLKINLVLGHQLPFPPTRGGGVENLNWMLAREYARCGHEVVAYSRADKGLASRETDAHGVRHVRIRGYDLHPNLLKDHHNALRYANRLRRVLEPADVTSFHTPFSFWLRKMPKLGVCTHTIHRTPKWIVKLYRGLDRVYGGSNAVIEQARAIDPRISNLKRVYNCITISDEPFGAPEKSPNEGLLFLYVGRFVPDKGIASLVKGFARALEQFPNNQLKTVGPQKDEEGADGAFFSEMKAYVEAEKLGDKIEFLPPIFDKPKLNALMNRADVVCVPTLTGETFSMAVLEGMALRKPTLVSDFGPMPEAVEHERTGYIARADDEGSLAEGIGFFSGGRERLPQLGQNAWEKARDSFSVEIIAREYVEDFRELIAKKK